MNVGKIFIWLGPILGITTLGLAFYLPMGYIPLIGFGGLVSGIIPLIGYIIYRKTAPTAFAYADAKASGKTVLWVFREDKKIIPVQAEFDSGRLVVGEQKVIVNSPEDIYLLDNTPTAILYRPVGMTLDPKQLFNIQVLEKLGYDRKDFMREMEEFAFVRAFKEKYEKVFNEQYQTLKASGMKDKEAREKAARIAQKEAMAYAQTNLMPGMANPNKMPQDTPVLLGEKGGIILDPKLLKGGVEDE